MLDKWTGEVIGTMHIYGITQKQMAERMHINEKYFSAIMNCRKRPEGAELRVRAALHDLLREVGDNTSTS